MTVRTAFTLGVLIAAMGPLPLEAQRARVRSGDAQDTNRSAVARAPEAAPAAPASAAPPAAAAGSTAEGRTRRERPAPVTVSPTVTVPTDVSGSFAVGEPVVVGSRFSVGGSREKRETDRDDGDRRRRRGDRNDDVTILPVYVPVIVPGSAVTTTPAYLPSEERASTVVGAASHRTAAGFIPWFQVGTGLLAGVPRPLPSPGTFDEGNVSTTVTELRGDEAGATRAYAPGTGGVSFDLVPAEAAVFVDGEFVGSVEDFAPGREPLLLRFGAYAFELRAEGYRHESFRLDVPMGEVLPIAGALEKLLP